MSMNIYPLIEPAAFILYGNAAKLIWSQVFKDDDGNPEPYDPGGLDELSHLFDAVWSNSFCGSVESLFPELSKHPLETSYDDETLVAIPCDKSPDLFIAAYPDKEALRKEFEAKFLKMGVIMPEDFDWWRYIVKIDGTDFSYGRERGMIKVEYPYSVVVSYSFDGDVGVYPCKSEEEAVSLLRKFFESEVAEDRALNHDFEAQISEDGWSATITNFRRNGEVDHTWWKIGNVYGEGKDFK